MESQPTSGFSRDRSRAPILAAGSWVGWWSTLPDSEDREALGPRLFGQEAESLRDLTGSEEYQEGPPRGPHVAEAS